MRYQVKVERTVKAWTTIEVECDDGRTRAGDLAARKAKRLPDTDFVHDLEINHVWTEVVDMAPESETE